jgi:light-harvesting complex I chlorophyll a/b binding protein 1
MKVSALLLFAGSSATAFAPSKHQAARTTLTTKLYSLNGWVPNENEFAFGLPGSIAPIPEFDPFNFAEGADLEKMKQYREAELQHGRAAMLGAVGMLVTEEPIEYHPLFQADNKDIGPAIRHLDEVRAVSPFFFEVLAIIIGALELNRALKGWENPGDVFGSGRVLKPDYYPGDVGFDPLNLKPDDPEAFAEIQTKELQNGRLAMLGWAGMVAQELVNGKEIFVNLGVAPDRFDPSTLPVQF